MIGNSLVMVAGNVRLVAESFDVPINRYRFPVYRYGWTVKEDCQGKKSRHLSTSNVETWPSGSTGSGPMLMFHL